MCRRNELKGPPTGLLEPRVRLANDAARAPTRARHHVLFREESDHGEPRHRCRQSLRPRAAAGGARRPEARRHRRQLQRLALRTVFFVLPPPLAFSLAHCRSHISPPSSEPTRRPTRVAPVSSPLEALLPATPFPLHLSPREQHARLIPGEYHAPPRGGTTCSVSRKTLLRAQPVDR